LQRQSNGCPVPQSGTGRYKINDDVNVDFNVKGARLTVAATKSKAKFRRD